MIRRLVQCVPNPLTLTQWAFLFRIACLLKLVSFGVGLWLLLYFAPSAAAIQNALPQFVFHYLRLGVEFLVLVAAADLLDYLAGRRERLTWGRRLPLFLLTIGGSEFAFVVTSVMLSSSPASVMSFLTSTRYGLSSLGWAAIYLSAGLIAFRFMRPLLQSREHAIPLDGQLEFATRRLAFAPGRTGLLHRILTRVLSVAALLLIIGGLAAVLPLLGQLTDAWIVGVPGSGRSASQIGYQTITSARGSFGPALLLLALAAWIYSLTGPVARPAISAFLPLMFWILCLLIPISIGLLFAALPQFGAPQLLVSLLSGSWAVAFAGAGFAVRHISEVLQAAKEEHSDRAVCSGVE